MKISRPLILQLVTLIFLIAGGSFPAMTAGQDSPSGSIIIDGEASLTTSPYVRSGLGTQGDPYIISDYDMTAYDIQIKNTTSYVIVRNVTFSQAGSWAIYLYNSRNVILDNISCSSRSSFLYSYNCRNILVADSDISNIGSSGNCVEVVNGISVTIQDTQFIGNPSSYGAPIDFNNQGSGHVIRRCRLEKVDYTDGRFADTGDINNNTFVNATVEIVDGNLGGSISDNTFIHSTGNNLEITTSYRLTIERNYFEAPMESGIYYDTMAWQSNSNRGWIAYNIFESCKWGIRAKNDYFTRITYTDFHHNYFSNCTDYAIELNWAYYNRAWMNIFYNNAGTGDSGGGSQVQQNAVAAVYENKWTVDGKGNFWANHRTPDRNNDGFVDVNYTISSGGLDTRPFTNPYFDTERPDVKILNPSGPYSAISYVRSRWEAGDRNSGLDSLELSLDEGEWVDVTHKTHHSLFLKKGLHTISMKAKDKAGLYNITSREVMVNETRDLLFWEEPEDGEYYSRSTIRFEWSVKEYFLPVNQTLRIDGNATYLSTAARVLTKDLEEGEHHVDIIVRDDDDLEFAKGLDIIVDISPPEIIVHSPLDGAVYSNDYIRFDFEVTDNFELQNVEFNFNNGAGWIDKTGFTEFSELLSSGLNTVFIKATDAAGLVTNRTLQFRLGGDTGLEIITPLNGLVTKDSSVAFSWDYNGTFQWERSILKVGRTGIFEDIFGAKEWQINLPSEGEYPIILRLEDIYENYLETGITIYRDIRPPLVNFVDLEDGQILNSGTVDLRWRALDGSGFPVVSYELRIDGGPWEDQGNRTGKILMIIDGEHRLGLKATDRAGNTGQIEIVIFIDTISPEIEMIAPSDGQFLNDPQVEFRWEVQDNVELSNVTLVIDGTRIIDVTGTKVKTTTIQGQGYHIVDLIAFDKAGNSATVSIRLLLDIKPPSLFWDDQPIGYTNDPNLRLIWILSDEFGISNITVEYGDRTLYPPLNSSYVDLVLEDGNYTFTVTAIDLVGNTAQILYRSNEKLVVDRTPPEVLIDTAASVVYFARATLYWIARDGTSGIDNISIKLDDGEFENIGTRKTFAYENLPRGEHTVTVQAVDRCGNINFDTWTFTIFAGIGDEGEGEEGIPFTAWMAIIIVGVLLLFLVLGVIISRTRSREKTKIIQVNKPKKIGFHLPSSPPPATVPLSPGEVPMDLPSASYPRVEETEEGSGYIRPERKKKKDPKIQEERVPDQGIAEEAPEPGPAGAGEPEVDTGHYEPPPDLEGEEETQEIEEDQVEPPDLEEVTATGPQPPAPGELDEVPLWDEDEIEDWPPEGDKGGGGEEEMEELEELEDWDED
ncbi:MAG: hypothetical protein ACMUIE_09160 [Thermoplasmatota archaeon]